MKYNYELKNYNLSANNLVTQRVIVAVYVKISFRTSTIEKFSALEEFIERLFMKIKLKDNTHILDKICGQDDISHLIM